MSKFLLNKTAKRRKTVSGCGMGSESDNQGIGRAGMAGQYYKVKECEYLRQIALEHGFLDPNIIWNHPNNAKLKAKRKYHNVLNPGDILFIPDKTDKNEARGTT